MRTGASPTRAGAFRRSALSALLFAIACGPSLTTVHEGTVRFEHCHRLDLDESVRESECRACWKKWLASYTYGQTHDRIEHARRRVLALSNGGERPKLQLSDERRPEERQFYLVVPSPTSVHAPPPPIATVWKGADAGVAKAALEAPPADGCADGCRSTWKDCTSRCSPDAGADGGACGACGEDYASCMRGCFE